MKVFISWSGDISKRVGATFNDWLPQVSHSIKPFFSDDDIAKGTRWSQTLARELDSTAVGLLCVTPENLDSRWLNFEAGAISTALGNTPERPRVMPFLFGLRKVDVQLPLSDFQMTAYEKDDIWKLIQSINLSGGNEELDEVRLLKSFDRWWPDLEDALNAVLTSMGETNPVEHSSQPASIEQILEELLELARDQSRVLSSTEFQSLTIKQRSPASEVPRATATELANSWDSFTDALHGLIVSDHVLPRNMIHSIAALSESIDGLLTPLHLDAFSPDKRLEHLSVINSLVQGFTSNQPGSIEEVPWDDGEPPF